MAFSLLTLAAYAFEWLAFLFILALSMSRLERRKLSPMAEVIILGGLVFLAAVTWILANNPSGPDIGFYAKALAGFVATPVSFYTNFELYTYPPLQLYLSSIPYLFDLSPSTSLWIVSIAADLASGIILYLLLGRGLRGLTGTGLLLFNPYYAQYSIVNLTSEALITPFLLGALFLFRRNDKASGFLLGISALAKQQVVYPAFALFVNRLAKNKPQSLKFLLTAASTFALFSIPFLLYTPLTYLGIITARPLGYQRLGVGESGGATAFSTFWSALNYASTTTGLDLNSIQALRTFVWIALMGIVVFVVVRRTVSASHVSVLGYIPYILASDFAGGWYLIVFIPLLIPVYLDPQLSGSERRSALLMLLSMLPYRLADLYSFLTKNSPPYIFGDIFLGLASLYFVLVAAHKSLASSEPRSQVGAAVRLP